MIQKLLLYVAIFCIYMLNRAKVDDNAYWDDAQNFAEWLVKKNRVKLCELVDRFQVLESRIHERVVDLMLEQD